MAPKPSKHAISSSSFLDLKATISAHESDFKKSRTGQATTTTNTSKGSGVSQWAKQNKGLSKRQLKDNQVVYEDDHLREGQGKGDPERIRERLEKKARIYDKIRRGKTGGLNESQIDSLLVDFDRDPAKERNVEEDSDQDDEEEDRDEVDESSIAPERRIRGRGRGGEREREEEEDDDQDEGEPGPPLPNAVDPLVEFTDEFGRTRLIPRSEVPRGQPYQELNQGGTQGGEGEGGSSNGVFGPGEGPESSNVLYGDQTSFPVYEPDPSILAARAASLLAAQNAPLVDHYDSTRETTRQRGAGFYQFSGDEQERERQRKELEEERSETERKRREREVEGDRVRKVRKEEVEERRRLIEEKRREVEEKRAKKRQRLISSN